MPQIAHNTGNTIVASRMEVKPCWSDVSCMHLKFCLLLLHLTAQFWAASKVGKQNKHTLSLSILQNPKHASSVARSWNWETIYTGLCWCLLSTFIKTWKEKMAVKGPASGGSCFLPSSSGNASNTQNAGSRQVFGPTAFGRQECSHCLHGSSPRCSPVEASPSRLLRPNGVQCRLCLVKGEANLQTHSLELYNTLRLANPFAIPGEDSQRQGHLRYMPKGFKQSPSRARPTSSDVTFSLQMITATSHLEGLHHQERWVFWVDSYFRSLPGILTLESQHRPMTLITAKAIFMCIALAPKTTMG